jgi:hypothetical protein
MATDPNEKYTKNLKEDAMSDFEGEAEPGKPLAPDELPENPPQFQGATQSARKEQDVHPTSELSSTPSHKPGKPSSGKHPTSELHVKPRGRK